MNCSTRIVRSLVVAHLERPNFSRHCHCRVPLEVKIDPGGAFVPHPSVFTHSCRLTIRVHQPPRAMATKPSLLVLSSADSPELKVLEKIKHQVNIVGIGATVDQLQQVPEYEWGTVDVALAAGVGALSMKRADLQVMWPKLTGLKWLHSASAGLDSLLFPELIESDVVVTNAKGVYSHSLAEYALTCCNWFAKDIRRMRASQSKAAWDPFDVEELRGKTMGIIGYGDIGQACGRLAKAFQMHVVALRRRPKMSEADEQAGVLDRVYGPDCMLELIASSDYIVMATPFTPATHKLFGAAAVAAMQPHAVFINVGRGKCVDEQALTEALEAGKIRGAGLDVFYEEPLPADSRLYKLDNVLMSAHCADRTKEFQFSSLEFFVQNLGKYVAGEAVENQVDKKAGY